MPGSSGQPNKLWRLGVFEDNRGVARRRGHDPLVKRDPHRILCTRLEIVHSAGVVLVAEIEVFGVGAFAFLLIERKRLRLIVGPALLDGAPGTKG